MLITINAIGSGAGLTLLNNLGEEVSSCAPKGGCAGFHGTSSLHFGRLGRKGGGVEVVVFAPQFSEILLHQFWLHRMQRLQWSQRLKMPFELFAE